MTTSANSSTNAKLLSDLQKFAASAGIRFPAGEPAASTPSPTPAADAAPSTETVTAAPVPPATPSTGNAAVDRCLEAYAEACRKGIAAGKRKFDAESEAKADYKRAMPPLVGPQNVADFIACVTRGAIESLLYPDEVTRFLYAAQVANCVKNPNLQPAPKKPRGRPSTHESTPQQDSIADNSSVNNPDES